MTTAPLEGSRRFHLGENLFRAVLFVAAVVVLVTMGAILIILFESGHVAFQKFGVAFIWLNQWDPVRDLYGAAPAIVGTLATSFLALVLAWPIGFGIAYVLTEICPRPLRGPVGVAVELLAAVPSIVYGMWGFFVLAPVMSTTVQPWLTEKLAFLPPVGEFYWFSGAPVGVGLFTASVVLAIMILPFIAAASRDVLQTTPQLLKEGGYAMGATRWEVLTGVVIPAVRGSLFGAVFLGLGRALGETMAVTFVIGNANRLPDSFYAPTASIASIVANEFPDADQGSLKLASLFALGFILFVVSFFVLALARLLLRQGRMA
ncbi:MAG: phosphate ABC transporter permease subunit PstC [Hyphomonadaceae bacterium]|nr:MAG: phosphate transport system permease protein [Caulobacteraceae bacterium]MBT9445713.1 phosphate ABC transporter permease subunit PstC [Hyphomonadaceae bacterium]TPW08746.1 MAG: phosphate transport system permease protein [Alphaproteobacteria bacterium]